MLFDGLVGRFSSRQCRIFSDVHEKRALILSLTSKKSIENYQARRRNRGSVSMRSEQIVCVHGDEQAGVGVLLGNDADGAIADGEIVLEIDLFKRGIFADKLG